MVTAGLLQAPQPSVASFYMTVWIVHCRVPANQNKEGKFKPTFPNPTVQMSKPTNAASCSVKERLILLPGNFSLPQTGAQEQLFSKLKEMSR
jgi:hypothetical protein